MVNVSIDDQSVCDSCDCAPGYKGLRCENNVDDCEDNKCSNNSTCVDLVQAYRCECAPGFMGEYCEEKIPFCTKGHDPCENGGRCVDHGTHYSCECPIGFTGLNCSTNLDDCVDHMCQVSGAHPLLPFLSLSRDNNEGFILVLERCYLHRRHKQLRV